MNSVFPNKSANLLISNSLISQRKMTRAKRTNFINGQIFPNQQMNGLQLKNSLDHLA